MYVIAPTDTMNSSQYIRTKLKELSARHEKKPVIIVIVVGNEQDDLAIKKLIHQIGARNVWLKSSYIFSYNLAHIEQFFPQKYTYDNLILILRYYFWLYNHKRWLKIKKLP